MNESIVFLIIELILLFIVLIYLKLKKEKNDNNGIDILKVSFSARNIIKEGLK